MISVYRSLFAYGNQEFSLRLHDFTVAQGESVVITGPSGSGKTTLLNLLAGVIRPVQGEITVADFVLTGATDNALRDFRISRMGLIFQEFELLEYLSVLDNILLPCRISASLPLNREIRQRALELAQRVGISDKMLRLPGQLSQGERQRVAVCRALLNRPAVILADEPTGNLDPDNKTGVMDLLLAMARENESTVVAVTHDLELTQRFDRHVTIADLLTAEDRAA
jgi:putative ABC transport system ATP-binding protein